MTKQEQGKKLGRIITKAWEDAVFKQRLLRDATAVLKEEGVRVPEGLEVKAVENTEKTFHMVIPPVPGAGELTDAFLAEVSGGGCTSSKASCHPEWNGKDGWVYSD